MLFQAVRNERRGLVVGSLIPNTKVPSSTPSLKLQKKTKNGSAPHHQILRGASKN